MLVKINNEDKELIQATSGKKRIVILNRQIYHKKLNMDEVRELVPEDELITTSVLKKTGVDKLEERLQNYSSVNREFTIYNYGNQCSSLLLY